jgi:hypothetical protein
MSYLERFGRSPDFRVRYQWLPQDDAEVRQRPFQHIRCDFSYEGDDIQRTGIYMIWPEFEDLSGQPIPESGPVPESGTATMWIINNELRDEVHRQKVKPGARGYFMVGARRIAEVEVTEVPGLDR